MRVAVVHSFYSDSQPSGENEMVEAEVAALRRAGHAVEKIGLYTDDLSQRSGYRIKAFSRTASGLGPSPLRWIEDSGADLVHIHNLFPNYGRTWTRRLPLPLVATLHNYRTVCAKATLLRDGGVCTDCIERGPLPGLIHKCYRGKARATLPLTLGQLGTQRDILHRADRLIVLSETQKRFFVDAGVDPDKMAEVANFLPDALDEGPGPGGERWLYAGRLSPEKGTASMLAAWPASIPLAVVGTGPEEGIMRELSKSKSVTFLGHRSRSEVVALMRTSRGLAFPSHGPEPFGLVYIEALAAGTPVLATSPAAVAELIARDGTGMAVQSMTAQAVQTAHEVFTDLRHIARSTYERLYTEGAHVASLTEAYSEASAYYQSRAATSP